MPLYNFQCQKCGQTFEIKASFKEKEAGLEPGCPQCHSQETRQLITAGLFIRNTNGQPLTVPACGPDAGPGCC